MNWLDILILLSLLLSVLGGLFTGFLRGIISLIGLIAGIVIAGRLYPTFAPAFAFIHTEALANIGGASLDNEECYLLSKLTRALGVVYLEHQARL